jgi:hypothetical protein
MKIEIRLTGRMYQSILDDLKRRHAFAAERVGFAMSRKGTLANGGSLVLLNRYYPIPDEQYLDDPTVGARIGPEAITWAMQAVYFGRARHEGLWHVHLHSLCGRTGMSGVDRREIPKLVPGFQSVGKNGTHGILILSLDHASAWAWLPGAKEPLAAAVVTVIGTKIEIFESEGGE